MATEQTTETLADARRLGDIASQIAEATVASAARRMDGGRAIDDQRLNLKDIVVVPAVGHWVQQEQADEVSRLLIEFLQRL